MSEPNSSSSPPPAEGANAGNGPSPLTVGKRFVKQYYQVLSSTPDQIFRFYQPTSFISHAEGSTPTDPSKFEAYDVAGRWGGEFSKFELEHGAIDAQPSVNGSILLVVTGHVVIASDGKEDRKAFVHTFFLSLLGNSKRFYVHNDVLRFLNKDKAEADAPPATAAEETVVSPVEVEQEQAVVEKASEESPVEPEPEPVEEVKEEPKAVDDAPGGGVEETKEAAPEDDEDSAPVADEKELKGEKKAEEPGSAVEEVAPVVENKEEPKVEEKQPEKRPQKESTGKGKKSKGRGQSPSQQKQVSKQQPASKPVPGSWASLVASGGGSSAPAGSVPPSPAKSAAKPPAPEKTETAPESKKETPVEKETPKENNSGRQNRRDRPARDPDCTLVIKNLPDNTKESDLKNLFEKFASQAKAKIVGTTVASHRSLAFVDFDSVAPVLAAVEQHGKEPIQLKGQVLEVDQKTAEQRARRNVRGGYRSGSPGNGGMYRGGGNSGGGSGGRNNQYRRGDRSGNRGSGGGGGGGGRGGGRGNR